MRPVLKVLMPGRGDNLALFAEFVLPDSCRLLIKQQMVCAMSIVAIRILQAPCLVDGQYVVLCKSIELTNIVRELDNRRILCSVRQHEVLHEKLYIADATDALLEVEVLLVAAVQLFSHALPHRYHVIAQCFFVQARGQCCLTNLFEALGDRWTTDDGPRAQQRLVLPGPGVLFLVSRERFGVGNQQP